MLTSKPCLLFGRYARFTTSFLYANYHQKARSVIHPPSPSLQLSQAVSKFHSRGRACAKCVHSKIASSFSKRKIKTSSWRSEIGILYLLSQQYWRLNACPTAKLISLMSCSVMSFVFSWLRFAVLISLQNAALVETKTDLLSHSAYATEEYKCGMRW